MNFIEAMKTLKNLKATRTESYKLIMSGTPDQLVLFARAESARIETDAKIGTIPFGTLTQYLMSPPSDDQIEIIILTPFDLVPAADWRSGAPTESPDYEAVMQEADKLVQLAHTRPTARLFYLPAPILPIYANAIENARLELDLQRLAVMAGGIILPANMFSMATYLSSGNPVASHALGDLAERIQGNLQKSRTGTGKVLVTDLDHVMWHGIVGEDGPDGVNADSQGVGFVHYVYQSYLKALIARGVIVAAVSRNDPEIARAPFRTGNMLLKEDDFVTIIASYNAKSAQIKNLAQELNLGLDSFVFVDDNPVEIAEVSATLPDVLCVPFPAQLDSLPTLFNQLEDFFSKDVITGEDRKRTDLYKTRLKSMPPSEETGANLISFLTKLNMRLVIHERSEQDFERAVQLINKTNQFNLNGKRYEASEVAAILNAGGRLFTATLSDNNGSHGEIIAFLMNAEGLVVSWVMSCRVFQRQVEYGFLSQVLKMGVTPRVFSYEQTDRNEPVQKFFDDAAFIKQGDTIQMNIDQFLSDHGSSLDLFLMEDEAA